jgi:hypothetical protein
MSRSKLFRAGLLFISMLGLMAIATGTAFAAGAPKELYGSYVEESGLNSINHVDVEGTANPNGAETTVYLEYRKDSAAEYTTWKSAKIGSGTSRVQVTGLLGNLSPDTLYDLRTRATNSFGTTYSRPEPYIAKWTGHFVTVGSGTAEVRSSGITTLEYSLGVNSVKVECNESGHGTIGNVGGVGDSFHPSMSGCVTYVNHEKAKCVPKPFSLSLNQVFESESKSMTMPGCPAEEGGGEHVLSFVEPFFFNLPAERYKATQPVTMTTTAIRDGGTPVHVTFTSSWSLAGPNEGLLFGISVE